MLFKIKQYLGTIAVVQNHVQKNYILKVKQKETNKKNVLAFKIILLKYHC